MNMNIVDLVQFVKQQSINMSHQSSAAPAFVTPLTPGPVIIDEEVEEEEDEEESE